MYTVYVTRVPSVAEVNPLVDVALQAFFDDPLYTWFNTNPKSYPDEFRDVWDYLLKSDFATPGVVVTAAYSAGLEIMGFAVWHRLGESETAKSWRGDSMIKRTIRLQMMMRLLWKYLNQRNLCSLSFSKLATIKQELGKIGQQQPKEHWRLCLLGVLPEHQRRGIGRRLLQWGLDRCDEEQVPCVLEATAAGQSLYESVGFIADGWMEFDNGKQKQALMSRPPMAIGRVVV